MSEKSSLNRTLISLMIFYVFAVLFALLASATILLHVNPYSKCLLWDQNWWYYKIGSKKLWWLQLWGQLQKMWSNGKTYPKNWSNDNWWGHNGETHRCYWWQIESPCRFGSRSTAGSECCLATTSWMYRYLQYLGH